MAHLLAQATRVQPSPGRVSHVEGTLSVDGVAVQWRPRTPSEPSWSTPLERILSAELHRSRPGERASAAEVVIVTPEDALHLWFTNDVGSAREVASTVRARMEELFGDRDELRIGGAPPRYRAHTGPQATVSVSELSWGEATDPRRLKVELAIANAPYAWKRRVLLREELHHHLLEGFEAVGLARLQNTRATIESLGKLLLDNTLTAGVVRELEDLEPSSLVLRVDESLAHLPWGVVYDGSRFTFLEHPTSQQITLEAPLRPPRRTATSAHRRMLIIANPRLDLPSAEAEADEILDEIAQLNGWEVDVLRGSGATLVAVMSALGSGRYDLVHYAGHSSFNRRNPEASTWWLHDGDLSTLELRQNLEGHPPTLVYSSSCEAGRDAERGHAYRQRVLGLASAFLSAGVRNYVGSFWPIPDDEAKELARRFYEALADGETTAEALRLAKMESHQRSGSSALWAGMALFGDPSTTLACKAW